MRNLIYKWTFISALWWIIQQQFAFEINKYNSATIIFQSDIIYSCLHGHAAVIGPTVWPGEFIHGRVALFRFAPRAALLASRVLSLSAPRVPLCEIKRDFKGGFLSKSWNNLLIKQWAGACMFVFYWGFALPSVLSLSCLLLYDAH